MAILVFMIPESPSWLLHKRLYQRADEALAWLGMDQEQFVTEVEMDMQHRLEKVEKKYFKFFIGLICLKVLRQQRERNNVDEEGCLENLQKSCAKIFRKSTLVPLFIIITLFLIQNWSGFIVTIMYTVTIFEEARIDLDEFQATILVGCVQVLGTTVGTVILNITGRRPLLMLSTGLCSLFMGKLGTIFFLKTHEPSSVIVTSAGSWLALASLLGFTFSFTLGLGPIPWVLVGVYI